MSWVVFPFFYNLEGLCMRSDLSGKENQVPIRWERISSFKPTFIPILAKNSSLNLSSSWSIISPLLDTGEIQGNYMEVLMERPKL